jgi:hypothetical protein
MPTATYQLFREAILKEKQAYTKDIIASFARSLSATSAGARGCWPFSLADRVADHCRQGAIGNALT